MVVRYSPNSYIVRTMRIFHQFDDFAASVIVEGNDRVLALMTDESLFIAIYNNTLTNNI